DVGLPSVQSNLMAAPKFCSRKLRCPLWVKGRHSHRKTSWLLSPRKQTCAAQKRMSALGQKRTSGRPQTNTATRGRITLISVNSPGCVLLMYSGRGPLLETTPGLDRVVNGAIAVERKRP